MTAAEAQLRFAADFALVLVAGSGLALLAVRPLLLVGAARARTIVAAGFALLVAAAFASGGGFVDADATALVAVRLAAVACLAVAPVRWPGSSVGRVGFAVGLVALLGGELAMSADADAAADGLRLASAAAIGAGIVVAARRSIPTRIAASASATLLVVVLAVSVALSAVLADNVEDEARRRLADTATSEGALAEQAGRTAESNASLTASALAADAAATARIVTPTEDGRLALIETLERFADEFLLNADPRLGPILVLTEDAAGPRRLAVAVPAGAEAPSEAVLAAIQGSEVVVAAGENDDPVQSVVAAGDAALAVAAAPIEPRTGTSRAVVGLLVVTSRLDGSYVDARLALGPTIEGEGLALVTRAGDVVASSDGAAPTGATALAADAIDGGRTVVRTIGTQLVAAHPVLGNDGVPVLAIVATTPIAAIQDARADLFRLLFLIAIGGTLLALVLTAVVGERIGAGLRRLTVTAGEVQAGDLTAESGIRSDDEVGVLSDAFDSMTGSLRRMTDELRAAADDEARLRARMEAVVSGMGEALVAVDAAGVVTDFNPAAELLTGVAARKAIGRPVDQVVRATTEDGTDLSSRLAQPAEEGWVASATVLHTTGLEVPVAVSAGSLRSPQDEVTGGVFLLRDVRREREVDRIKSELLSNISHELRTPLSPIKGYSQILRARQLPPAEVRRFANEIEKASARLERVVVQLVNFASMSAGAYEVRTEPTLVREVVDRAVARWTDRLDPDVHPIHRRLGRRLPKVWLDRVAIDQALDELLDNAVKYSPAGGRIDVAANAAFHPALGATVRLSVTDRGVGIPTDRRDVVLDEFTQADGSATRSYGGLGLGLALVGRIVRAHGGELELVSVEEKGTTLTMVLPVGAEG